MKDAALVGIFGLYEDSEFSPEGPGFGGLEGASSKLFWEECNKNHKLSLLFSPPSAGLGMLIPGEVHFVLDFKRTTPLHRVFMIISPAQVYIDS